MVVGEDPRREGEPVEEENVREGRRGRHTGEGREPNGVMALATRVSLAPLLSPPSSGGGKVEL